MKQGNNLYLKSEIQAEKHINIRWRSTSWHPRCENSHQREI